MTQLDALRCFAVLAVLVAHLWRPEPLRAGVPRAHGQRTPTPPVPARRAVVHALAGAPRRARPLEASPPGSMWWRAVNERLLLDGCETIALLGGMAGEPSSRAVELWLEFAERPTGRHWYRAHNATIVAGYLEHRDLAEKEPNPSGSS